MSDEIYPARTTRGLHDIGDLMDLAYSSIGEHLTLGDEPSEIEWDNTLRAGFVASAVVTFAQRVGNEDEDLATILVDMLADLRHLVDAIGDELETRYDLDSPWSELLASAADHYHAEIRGQT